MFEFPKQKKYHIWTSFMYVYALPENINILSRLYFKTIFTDDFFFFFFFAEFYDFHNFGMPSAQFT